METLSPQEITRLLADWNAGDREALERLAPLVYAAQFVFFMVEFYPYTTDPSAWYAGSTLFAAGVIWRSPSTASASRSAGARSSAGGFWRISAYEGQGGSVEDDF